MREGYIPKNQRKKILLLSDDLRLHSGIATISREIVLQTCHIFNWIQLGANLGPDAGRVIVDVSNELTKQTGVEDAFTQIYPYKSYGDADILRTLIQRENPDAIMFFTDPRYWKWLFELEREIRTTTPLIYLNIWDDLPAPLYNKSFYESCDALFAISKQTYNINKLVLGDAAKDKVIKYTPHGINHELFYKITPEDKQFKDLQVFKKELFGNKEYDFVVFFNSRNLRRKCPSDLIAAYRVFCDTIGPEASKKCLLLMHTDPLDQNGTDLIAVTDLLCNREYMNIKFTGEKYEPIKMNLLYNLTDVVCLPSSNEGWGLSLTEGMMCERMIIGTVTGGIQDQMRFENEEGKWIEFDANFPSNHFGTFRNHGAWAVPVFPSNSSMVGSLETPYIFDDRVDFRTLASAIKEVYDLTPEERIHRGKLGREWLCSDEARMTGELMGKNIIEGINETLKVWKPRKNFDIIKIEPVKQKHLVHKLTY